MEEIISLIFEGCKQAKALESNLPNLLNQPNILSSSFDDIIKIFSDARERLNVYRDVSTPYTTHDQETSQLIGGAIEEWLRYNSINNNIYSTHHQQNADTTILQHAQILESQKTSDFDMSRASGGLVQPPVEVVGSGSSSSQRIRKRDADKTIMRVPAPRMGNTEIPPEDGYTWRKYGQKEILGSRFPRGYYRCTHQKLYQCPARKQVQRLDNDPNTFEILYRGDHTCTTSLTAPSTTPSVAGSNLAATSHWLSMNIKPSMESSSMPSLIDMQMYRMPEFGLTSGSGSTSGGYPVMDLADVMFNTGTSSSNSMDIIFSSKDENKWEAGEKSN